MSFAVITDTSANLPTAYLREHGIGVVPFSYYIDGRELSCKDTEGFDGDTFYDSIRSGVKVTTSMINADRYEKCFRAALEAGEDLVYVGMSSGISGSCSCAEGVADSLRSEYPDRAIITVDTFGASLGEGLLVMLAAELRDRGFGADEARSVLEDRRAYMCQVFTVDDLMHLRSTGRLSNAAALIGRMLNIKPLLKGDTKGRIVAFRKVRGRRRSIEAMAEEYDRLVDGAAGQVIGIAQAGCRGDAEALCELLRKNHPPRDILTVEYEPVTGSHVGPGALALFFFGNPEFRGEKTL